MFSIECTIDNLEAKIEIHEEKLIIKSKNDKPIFFNDVKSVNVKNLEKFLLKIKIDDASFIFEFENMHLRDLVKGIILDRIQLAESIPKTFISSNVDYNRAFRNVKTVVGESQFIKTVDIHPSLYFQKSIQEITLENFYRSLNQPLVDVFITMNCTISQFFNLLVSSYFYDAKNQKNAFDRLLLLRLRDFGSSMDYASRINSYSLLNMAESSEYFPEQKTVQSKPIDFEPIYPFHPSKKEYSNSYDFKVKELIADFAVEIQNEEPQFIFDQSDFETAKELCKLMFISYDEKIAKFSDDFTNLIVGKYGKEAFNYVSRLIPTFYRNTK